MASNLAADESWTEEGATEILLKAVRPELQVAKFSRRQESQTGADWLWWWVDDRGEAFGLLIQAKRVFEGASGFRVEQPPDQYARLVDAGHRLGVASAYALYTGESSRLDALPDDAVCPLGCAGVPGDVLLVDHLVVDPHVVSTRDFYGYAANFGIPFESIDMSDSEQPMFVREPSLLPVNLSAFLQGTQTGARAVAREFVRHLQVARDKQFSATSATLVRNAGDQVFRYLPDDRGHFAAPYMVEALRGLRTTPPRYVRDIIDGQDVSAILPGSVGGVIVRHLEH